MENSRNYFAVINNNDEVIKIHNSLRKALKTAQKNNAYSVEMLESFDGYSAIVSETIYMSDIKYTKMRFFKQRIFSIIIILLLIYISYILDWDITFAAIVLPFMIYMLFTRKNLLVS